MHFLMGVGAIRRDRNIMLAMLMVFIIGLVVGCAFGYFQCIMDNLGCITGI